MRLYRSTGKQAFDLFNYSFMLVISFVCLFPLLHILAISLSKNAAVAAGQVTLWPVDFTWTSYNFVLDKPEFSKSFLVTVERVLIGVPVNMLMTVLLAYPLSKSNRDFTLRTVFVWFFIITMLFSGGLIPTYLIVQRTGLIDSLWALILPSAVPVFNVVLLLNFFRGLPKALEEAAFIDGASHWQTLWRVYLPLSLPALATLILFTSVGHWNEWFGGLIYMNKPEHYPLQSYLQTVIIQRDMTDPTNWSQTELLEMSDRTTKAAQIFLGSLPILVVYPFLQRYFIKGIVLGSVKE